MTYHVTYIQGGLHYFITFVTRDFLEATKVHHGDYIQIFAVLIHLMYRSRVPDFGQARTRQLIRNSYSVSAERASAVLSHNHTCARRYTQSRALTLKKLGPEGMPYFLTAGRVPRGGADRFLSVRFFRSVPRGTSVTHVTSTVSSCNVHTLRSFQARHLCAPEAKKIFGA